MVIELELFPSKIHVYCGGTGANLISSVESQIDRDGNPLTLTSFEKETITSSLDGDQDLGFCFECEDAYGHSVLWIKEYKGTPLDVATLTHEAAHCTFHIMRRAGINANEETEELFCYLQDFIVRKAIEWLVENGNTNTYRTERPI